MSFNHFSDAVQPPQSFCVKPSKTKCNGMSTQKMFQFSKTHFKKCNKKYQDDSVNVTVFCPAMCPWTCFQYWFWVRTFSGLFELKHSCKTFKRHLKLHGAFHSHICLFSNTGEELKNHFHQAISRLQKITATVPRATYQSPAKICQQTAHNESLIGESERPK